MRPWAKVMFAITGSASCPSMSTGSLAKRLAKVNATWARMGLGRKWDLDANESRARGFYEPALRECFSRHFGPGPRI
jgi:hypothetical protein